jgi:micrococcal nuclease
MAVLAWLVGMTGPATAAPAPTRLEGVVERVVDGDSLWLRAGDAAPLEVRLQGIDAPEGCQPGGPAAREMLAGFVLDKVVTAVVRGRDHYGRALATIEVDGLNVNQRMVAEGHAWSLRTRWDRGPYVAQERLAQALRRGVHAEASAEMPADFRRRHGPCQGAPATAGGAASTAGDAPARPPAGGTAPATSTSDLVIGGAPRRPATPASAGWRCDGRTQCSQMRSCEEATWFLQNCPGVKMDGNRDGVPCERQWCRP